MMDKRWPFSAVEININGVEPLVSPISELNESDNLPHILVSPPWIVSATCNPPPSHEVRTAVRKNTDFRTRATYILIHFLKVAVKGYAS
jgi:hypothetical protein